MCALLIHKVNLCPSQFPPSHFAGDADATEQMSALVPLCPALDLGGGNKDMQVL